MKGWCRKMFPFPIAGAERRKPVVWRAVWRHPRGRFVLVEYRVETAQGTLSPPIRECFWTKARGLDDTVPELWKGKACKGYHCGEMKGL